MNYGRWGFSGSPFQQTSLPPNDIGLKLLVGRDEEVSRLEDRLQGTRKAAVLEGLNGIGKTSVVNVAAHRLYKRHLAGDIGELYLPCRKIFQLRPDSQVEEFVADVFFEVAQTLIERQNDLLKAPSRPITTALDRWLNSPEVQSFQAGLLNVSGGVERTQSTTMGFERSGFRKLLLDALAQIFPDESLGGMICCIDNLELLQTSAAAKRLMEALRDELLQVKGLRWVLCGALGITYAFATSPRLDGYLHRPIVLDEVAASFAPEILNSRRTVFADRNSNPYLPILESDFDQLYKILRGNLRNVLSYTDNFCQWVADSQSPPKSTEDKHQAFIAWLETEADNAYQAATSVLTPTTRTVFKKACESGTFAPGDFKAFGFDTAQALRNYIKSLENVDLIASVRDDKDQRRKSIQVTPKGWLADYKLRSIPNTEQGALAYEVEDVPAPASEPADVTAGSKPPATPSPD